MRFVLASASPTRLRVLRDAGFDPEVVVSGVDEGIEGSASSMAEELAHRKAHAVASQVSDAVVLGCDSLVELFGRTMGKPASPADAVAMWHDLRGQTVRVWTGHCIVDTPTGVSASWIAESLVRLGTPSDVEIERYVATGEPLGAAGAFRLGGRSAAFIEHVDGDPGTVHGVSVSVVRMLLHELGLEVTDLWV
jgi:septum formation protein